MISTRQTRDTEKKGLGGWCQLFVTGYGKFMVGVVGRIQMLFLEVAKGVLQWNQEWAASVAGGTMASFPPAIDS